MKYLTKIFHFLGSIYFAIFLILAAAIFVIAGTFLESVTESHLYASYFTYSNPVFIVLLWGFFVNIFLSTLRRWPFKIKHIPFIITHIGLLMILGGSLIKSYIGVQGSMGILEGGGSNEILIPNSYALSIEKKAPSLKALIPVNSSFKIDSSLPELQLEVVGFSPHCIETLEVKIEGKRVNDVSESAKNAYLNALQFHLVNNLSEKTIAKGNLLDILDKELSFEEGSIKPTLHFNYSNDFGFNNPCLAIDLSLLKQKKMEKIAIPLNGDQSLTNINLSSPYLGAFPYSMDLVRSPSMISFKDSQNNAYLFSFDSHGRVFSQVLRKDDLTSIMEYDHGFGGYTVQTQIPALSKRLSRIELEKDKVGTISQHLKENLTTETALSPPLKFLKEACEKNDVDFENICLAFLREWNYSHGWLFPNHPIQNETTEKVISQLDWDTLPLQIKNGCVLSSHLFQIVEENLKEDKDLIEILTSLDWPLINSLKNLKTNPGVCLAEEMNQLLSHLTQEIFSVSHLVPELTRSGIQDGRLLSAYLRLYGIHWNSIESPAPQAEEDLLIECPFHFRHQPATPLLKLEENTPMISLRLLENGEHESLTLSFDRYGTGLKWPALSGKYRLRFQPIFQQIPYRIRLRQARQINYPNSSQPYSYESDLIITSSNTGEQIEKTISMNNVYETWDGYRFYLANIVPADEGSVKRVQIVVNYDPAKYWLTYPGCILLVLGIVLLFWFRKPKNKDKGV